MHILNFDTNGYLTPYANIEVDLETLEKYFVDDFPLSNTRYALFLNLLKYLEDFKSRVSRSFEIWLNGSFISQKQNPKDIDFVIFLDYEVFEIQEPFLDKFWCFSLEDKGLDAYLVKNYPKTHLNFTLITEKAQNKWLDLYGHQKQDVNKTLKKGFLKLKFE